MVLHVGPGPNAELEGAIGREADRRMADMQAGDVPETLTDISTARCDLEFEPKTLIENGLPRFVPWHRDDGGV